MTVSTILRISNPIVLNTESLIKKANPTFLKAMGLLREKIAFHVKQLDAYSIKVFKTLWIEALQHACYLYN